MLIPEKNVRMEPAKHYPTQINPILGAKEGLSLINGTSQCVFGSVLLIMKYLHLSQQVK